jgi:[ribosomal protein S5]-alanine N-acetyltransferase
VIAPARPPVVRTRRLVMRRLRLGDAVAVAALLDEPRVSRWLMSFAHPYTLAAASAWIARCRGAWLDGRGVTFAITAGPGELIGTVGLRIVTRHRHAELGYWLGVAHWGNGYATEAAAAVVRWAFRVLPLRRIYGQYLGDNHASGRVMEQIGMMREGVRRRHIRKAGRWYDAHQFGILREEARRPR